LNQDRSCNTATEDFNLDGVCNVSDCSSSNFIFTPLNIPNTVVMRDSNGSFAVDTITANHLYVLDSLVNSGSATIGTQNLAVQTIESDIDLTLQTNNPILYNVIVNDDLVVNGNVTVNSIVADPITNNIVLSGNNVRFDGTLVLESVSAYSNNISINANLDVNGVIAATNITSFGANNLTLSPASGSVVSYGNLLIAPPYALVTNEIRATASEQEITFSAPVSAGNISVDQIFAQSAFLTLFVSGVNINGTLSVGSIVSLVGTSVSFPNGINTPTIFGNPSVTLSASTGYVNINGTLRTDSITSYTNNTDLTLAGQGTGNVSVNATLKVDTFNEKTSGAATTFLNGIKFANSASGYTPTALSNIEQLNSTFLVTSVFTTNTSASIMFFRIGPHVSVSLRASLSGTTLSATNITLTGSIPTRFCPSANVYMPVYCQIPAPSVSCILEITSSCTAHFNFGGTVFPISTPLVIPAFTQKYFTT
jgi:hypothetical protein